MINKRISLFLVVLVFGGYILYYKTKERTIRKEPVSHLKSSSLYEIASAPVKKSMRFIPNSKSGIQINTAPTSQKIPMQCQVEWDRLISQGPEQFQDSLKTPKYEGTSSCFQFVPNSEGVRKLVEMSCRLIQGNLEYESMCRSSLFMYRALLIDLSTMEDKNFSKMPLQILLNKIFGRILQGEDVYKSNARDLRAMAAAVNDLAPNNPSSYRVQGAVEMILDNDSGAASIAHEGLNLDSNDPVLRDIWFYNQSKKQDTSLSEYVNQNPHDDIAAYYLASQLWKNGRLAESKHLLENLVKHYPENQRYKTTWSKLANSNDPVEQGFQIDIPMLQEGW